MRAVLLAGAALPAAVLAAMSMPAWAQPAPNARPQGGVVTGGVAVIGTTDTTTTITQTTQRAAIDWRSFDVGAQQTVRFDQPSSTATALNRVVGPNPSQIAGRIEANGQVILTNQDGITFYKGAQVNTAGFVGSASGITNQNFMSGRMVFDQPAHAGARIDNAGTISVSGAGLAALVAPQVANSGVITAKLGRAVLAGAETHTLDLYGDGLVNIDVTGQVRHGPAGQTALITNTGTIAADGGTVALTARAADGVVQTLIQAGGTVSASSSAGQGGRVLISGIGGDVTVTGAVLAQGAGATGRGGAVELRPSGTVAIAAGARVDASGTTRGGTIAVGTTLARAAGGPSVRPDGTSAGVRIAAGATIDASATARGGGGRVALLSQINTTMAGSIVARGGAGGGDGGFVEVSGGSLGYLGGVDVTAAGGATGSILFDPATLTIRNGAAGSLDGGLPNITGADGGTSETVSVAALEALAPGTNVSLEATSLLEVRNSVAFAADVTARLTSGGNLRVDAGVALSTSGTGAITLSAAGAMNFLAGASVTAPTVSLSAGAGGIVLGSASITATNTLTLATSGGGAITQGGAGTLTVGELRITSDGAVTLNSTHNAITTLGASSAGASLQLTNSIGLTVSGPVSATALALTASARNLTLAGDVTGTTSVRLAATLGNIVQTGGSITTGTLTASAGSAISLASATNAIDTVAGVTAGGAATITNGAALRVTGPVSGTNVTLDAITGNLTLAGAVNGTATVRLIADAGDIRQTAGRVVTPSLSADAAGTILLNRTTNAIGTITGAVATAGDLTIVNGADLTLTGTERGQTVAITVATAGGALTLGGGVGPATVTAAAGQATLTADRITAIAGSTVSAGAAGTITLAPFSANAVHLLGAGGLSLDATLLGGLTAGTFVIGSTTTASSIAIDGALNLGAATLDLLSAGGITQSAALTVGLLSATASGVTLDSALNGIGALGVISAGSGAITVTNAAGLTVAGPLGGGAVTLNTVTGDLTLAGDVVGTSVALTATAGNVLQTGGSIEAGTLSVSAGAGAVTLDRTTNAVTTLGAADAITNLTVVNGSALSVTGPVTAAAVRLRTESGNLTLNADIAGTTSVTLEAAAGSVVQTGGRVRTATLSGAASGAFNLGLTANTLTTAGSITAGAGLAVGNSAALAVNGPLGARFITLTAATGDLTIAGDLTATGQVALRANAGSVVQTLGSITAGSVAGNAADAFRLTSATNALTRLRGITAGSTADVLNGGALTVSGPVSGATVILATATGDLTLAGNVVGTSAGTGLVQLGATAGQIVQTLGSITADTLFASAASNITLGATGNAIGTVIGATAGTAGTGDLMLRNAADLVLTGTERGTNVTITLAAGRTLALGSGADTAQVVATGGTITLGTDRITEVAGSTLTAPTLIAVAPVSPNAISIAGSPGTALLLDTTFLNAISTARLLVGDATNTSAIRVEGAADLTGHATALELLAGGPITEPGGSLTVAQLRASGQGISLDSPLNAIGSVEGADAGTADLVLANGTDLALAGPVSGRNVTLGLTSGNTLALGTAAVTATADITLIADRITDAAGGTLVAPGTLSVTPTSANVVSVAGAASGAFLLLDPTFLAQLSTGRLVIGGAQATGISLDGLVDLIGRANTLDLRTPGAVTEPGGPLRVGALTVAAGTGVALQSNLNAIGRLAGASAGIGDLLLTNGADLLLTGAITGANVGLTLASGGATLSLGQGAAPAAVSAATDVTITADRITEAAGSSIAAPGTLTIAPFTANAVSLAGTAGARLLLDARLLSQIDTPRFVIGNTTTTTAISVDGAATLTGHAATLDLRTSGDISEAAGARLVVDTLLASAGGGIALGGATNAIGTLAGATASGGDLVIGNGADLTLLGAASGTNIAITLTSARTLAIGSAAGSATLTATGNVTLGADRITDVAGDRLTAPGTLTIAPVSANAISVAGTGGAGLLLDTTLLAAVDANVFSIGRAATTTGISIDGAADLTGRAAVLALTTSGAVVEPGGPLTAPVLTVTAGTGITLDNGLNAVGVLAAADAGTGDLTLTNATDLVLRGAIDARTITLRLNTAGTTLTFGDATAPATVVATQDISLTTDRITEVAGSSVSAARTLAIAPFSPNPISLAGGPGAQLLLDATFLGQISAPTLVIGDAAATTAITVDGNADLTGRATTLDLRTGGAISEAAGARLAVNTLRASAVSGIALGEGGNAIGVLDGVSTTNGAVVIADASDLTVNGPVTGDSIAMTTAGSLDVAALVQATADLRLASSGATTVRNTASLAATTATLTSGGTLAMEATATVLTDLSLTSTGALTLAAPGALSAATVSLNSAGAVTIVGGIGATDRLGIRGGAGVAFTGAAAVDSAAIQIDGGTGGIGFTGTGVIGNAASAVDLNGGGGITQADTSVIRAALLTSSTGVSGDVALAGTSNVIAAIGGFAVTAGGFTLADGGAATLTVIGPLSAGNIALGAVARPGTIQVTGAIAATNTVALTAAGGGITLNAGATIDGAAIQLAATGPIALLAGAGIGSAAATVSLSTSGSGNGVLEDVGARITAATLTSASGIAGAAEILGSANDIATVRDITAASLTLADIAPTLTLNGSVTVSGAAQIGTAARPDTLTLAGTISGASVTLNAGGGGMNLPGTLVAAGVAELTSGGGVRQTGRLTAATLQSAGVVGAANFADTRLSTLGSFAVTGGGLTLANTGPLVLAGPVSADGIDIRTTGSLTAAGSLTSTTLLRLTTSGGDIVLGSAAGFASLAAPSVVLNADGRISEPNGVITAGSLALTAVQSAELGNGANDIDTLAGVTVPGGTFVLRDDAAPVLTIAGPVQARGVSIAQPQTIIVTGSVQAETVTLVAGSVLAESGDGVILAGSLDASATDAITLGNAANRIGVLGTVTVAAGDLTLADDAAPILTVAGPVAARNIIIGTPGQLTIAGTVTDATETRLSAGAGGIVVSGSITAGALTMLTTGAITETGAITAASLGGTTAGSALLTGTNRIGEITSFTAGTVFKLANTTALTLSGQLTAPLIDIAMPGAAFTMADGARIVTGGTAQPASFVILNSSFGASDQLTAQTPSSASPARFNGVPVGAYLTAGAFTQLGTGTVTPIGPNADAVLNVQVGGAGDIRFGTLQARSTWLVLGLQTGNASGQIFVKSLTVQYPANFGGASLSGEINQIAGQAAAGAGTILPLPSNQFKVNNCPIRSVNCVLLPVGTAPLRNPLENFAIDAVVAPPDDESLLLPIVSDRDY